MTSGNPSLTLEELNEFDAAVRLVLDKLLHVDEARQARVISGVRNLAGAASLHVRQLANVESPGAWRLDGVLSAEVSSGGESGEPDLGGEATAQDVVADEPHLGGAVDPARLAEMDKAFLTTLSDLEATDIGDGKTDDGLSSVDPTPVLTGGNSAAHMSAELPENLEAIRNSSLGKQWFPANDAADSIPNEGDAADLSAAHARENDVLPSATVDTAVVGDDLDDFDAQVPLDGARFPFPESRPVTVEADSLDETVVMESLTDASLAAQMPTDNESTAIISSAAGGTGLTSLDVDRR